MIVFLRFFHENLTFIIAMLSGNTDALYGISCYIITVKPNRCEICGLWFLDCFLCLGASTYPQAILLPPNTTHIHKHTAGDMVLINKIIFSLIMHGERHVVTEWIPMPYSVLWARHTSKR